MKAIILAGGFGTRLESVLGETPKILAPIKDKPFIYYLISYLKQQGIKKIYLSVHYKYKLIQHSLSDDFKDIEFIIEEEPLGTGGAIKYALSQIQSDEPVFVINGDSFIKLNYNSMFNACKNHSFSLAVSYLKNPSRYGFIELDKDLVISFSEKKEQSSGYINSGVYLIHPDLFNQYELPDTFSLESDFIEKNVKELKPFAYKINSYFIDIGVPDDYARAQEELLEHLN